MNCIIVDDSELALMATEQCVKNVSYLNLMGTFTNPVDALSFIAQNNIDLIFLDVEMPVISGIDFIKSMSKPAPFVILTTMHKNYAFDAFENNVTDFLVKPISLPRFIQSISKVKNIYDKMNISYSDESSVFIKKGSSIVKMEMNDILWVESLGDYVTLNTAKEKIVVHSTMQSIEEKLSSGKFIRVHRSYLIQKDKIIDIEDDVITYYDQLIPIGKTYKKEVYKKLNLV
ncbi:MAG TPA: LytTR family DNA-binding domain-containing protein [Bacteroidia bacterium]|jgi:DNA-binding LytR/AlgR family response regulator|nr:LytTR family DNA-binding domain-containing protein [Bacteroidia bacterium]HQF27384.1 LytTR family DNA-binding domain-containing protein [Bacteroidia bacterium]HQK96482.1 LytTR family DNA-binding domain-containing protein [Bacteroidia bacterium]